MSPKSPTVISVLSFLSVNLDGKNLGLFVGFVVVIVVVFVDE